MSERSMSFSSTPMSSLDHALRVFAGSTWPTWTRGHSGAMAQCRATGTSRPAFALHSRHGALFPPARRPTRSPRYAWSLSSLANSGVVSGTPRKNTISAGISCCAATADS